MCLPHKVPELAYIQMEHSLHCFLVCHSISQLTGIEYGSEVILVWANKHLCGMTKFGRMPTYSLKEMVYKCSY